MKILAISLWQPHASLLFTDPPAKVHETRSFAYPAAYEGRTVLIHAAKRRPPVGDLALNDLHRICASRFGPSWWMDLPYGAFVGSTRLAGCRFASRDGVSAFNGADSLDDWLCGDWSPGRHAWRLEDRRKLAEPIPTRGFQGFWNAEIGDGLVQTD